MAAVAQRSSHPVDGPTKDPLDNSLIPEFIEERKRDEDGRIVLMNTYARGKLLGKGGFAKVFAGCAPPSKTTYALKIVAKCSLIKPRSKQKFQTEIKIHKSLRHINIVRFERFFEDSSFAYIVMELCSNNSMSELMKKRKTLTEPEARYYLIQIINSLQFLHDDYNLVIHRDLKLGNLFIDGDMRIKLGDFGLAAKLVMKDERRKTVCGTPNYIAPEILQGKDGHSFEVDVWSTGVILYTVLVGKPPFESKDVKSTYKRIVANSFAFPEEAGVSTDAKHLIRLMLNPEPGNRPSLQTVINHPFFRGPNAFTPNSLSSSTLREVPNFLPVPANVLTNHHSSSSHQHVKTMLPPPMHPSEMSSKSSNRQSDENDPNLVNRMHHTHHHNQPENINTRSVPSVAKKLVDNFMLESNKEPTKAQLNRPGSSNHHMVDITNTVTNSNPVDKAQKGYLVQQVQPAVSEQRRAVSSARPVSATNLPPAVERGYAAKYDVPKFDIYVDTTKSAAVLGEDAPQRRDVDRKQLMRDNREMAHNGSTAHIPKKPMTVSTADFAENASSRYSQKAQQSSLENRVNPFVGGLGYELDLDQMQKGLQHVNIAVGESRADGRLSAPTTRLPVSSVPPSSSARDSTPYLDTHARESARSVAQEAFAWEEKTDRFPPSRAVASSSSEQASSKSHSTAHPERVVRTSLQQQSSNGRTAEVSRKPSAVMTVERDSRASEPMTICTPPEQIMSKDCKQPLGTLETMHEMLNSSFSMVDQGLLAKDHPMDPATHEAKSLDQLVSKVWVVRYVDYTSKYGLGFLFNTGSAGVYFNDSTKIVLSADGSVFQYIERRRMGHSSMSEHVVQTHLMERYPLELQKKVTLLRHFRNYLLEQEKNVSRTADCGSLSGAADNFNGNSGLIRDGMVSEGATDSIPMGESSARYCPVGEDLASSGGGDKEHEMPFLKKWVHTKHAFLFRISNRTVQVVFYDRSEVLLSSEARLITYVNKQGLRTEHSLDDILTSGRLDIAKRLKYTKDIMHRLINTQSK